MKPGSAHGGHVVLRTASTNFQISKAIREHPATAEQPEDCSHVTDPGGGQAEAA